MDRTRTLIDGVVAGLLGALAVAVWFLLFDIGRGQPLATPSLLGAGLLHGATVAPAVSFGLVAQYTAVHFAAFAIIGAILGALVIAAEGSREFLFGLLIFLAAFEVFFIGVISVAGPAVSNYVTWWSVLVGNLLATGVIVGYFEWRHPNLGETLLGDWSSIFGEGVKAGVIGAVIVAVWFGIADLAVGAPLRTPAMLGAALFKSIPLTAEIRTYAALVAGYTVLHFAAFIAIGVIAAYLIEATEHQPLVLFGLFVGFVCFEIFFISMVLAFTAETLIEQLTWWRIIVGDVLATVGMASYFYRRHPKLSSRAVERWVHEAHEGFSSRA